MREELLLHHQILNTRHVLKIGQVVDYCFFLNPTFQHRNLGLPEPPENATKLDKNLHKLRLFQIVSDLYNCNSIVIIIETIDIRQLVGNLSKRDWGMVGSLLGHKNKIPGA